MDRFDGTAARQLELIESDWESHEPKARTTRPALRLLKEDVYAEIQRRRRRAQIAARRALAKAE